MSRRLRTLVLPSSFAALVFVANLGEAKAACATTDPSCSFGPATGLKASYTKELEDPAVGFDWGQNFGAGIKVQIGAGLRMVAKDAEPLFTVDMTTAATPPAVEASWGPDKIVKLRFVESAKADAKLSARYGLIAQVNFHGEAFGNDFDKSWDVTDLLTSYGRGEFDFNATGQQAFKPWAFGAPVDMAVAGGSIDTTDLFNLGLDVLGMPANWATGSFGVYLSTEGTLFKYQTLGAKFNGAASTPGQDFALPSATEYGDELSIKTVVQGGLVVAGVLYAKPYIQLDSLLDYNSGNPGGVSWPLRFSATSLSIRKDFRIPAADNTNLPFDFPEVTILVPIPNVKLAKDALTMTGKSGRVAINNTGKKAARVSFATTSSGFQVPGGEQEIPAGGSYDLNIVYTNSDSATGDVTINTNDPDSPVLSLKVGANGASVGDPDEGDDESSSGNRGTPGLGNESSDSGGCGCTTTGGAGQTAGFGALLGSVLAAMAFLRRRARS